MSDVRQSGMVVVAESELDMLRFHQQVGFILFGLGQ